MRQKWPLKIYKTGTEYRTLFINSIRITLGAFIEKKCLGPRGTFVLSPLTWDENMHQEKKN